MSKEIKTYYEDIFFSILRIELHISEIKAFDQFKMHLLCMMQWKED